MMSTAFRFVTTVTLMTACFSVNAQSKINVVTTAVPFLRISPDARSGGMGDLSIATTPDASSSYFNLGKVPFNESSGGVNITYTPSVKKLRNYVYQPSASGYYKLNETE